jgi:hypothetical protein
MQAEIRAATVEMVIAKVPQVAAVAELTAVMMRAASQARVAAHEAASTVMTVRVAAAMVLQLC